MYKRLHIHLLQAFFFLNFIAFAAGTHFLIIVGYHFYPIIPPSMHDSIQCLVAYRLKKKHCTDLQMDSVIGGNIHCVHAASAHTVARGDDIVFGEKCHSYYYHHVF